jgi:hypothetical protein
MAESKYGKYIVTELKKDLVEAPWVVQSVGSVSQGKGGRLFFLDSEVVEGAFYRECAWIMPPAAGEEKPKGFPVEPHTHGYDEVLCFFGTNPGDFYDLGGEIELFSWGRGA